MRQSCAIVHTMLLLTHEILSKKVKHSRW